MEFITMQFSNITNSEKITYGISFILSIITYFILINFFDDKTTTGISAVMFFIYSYLGLYVVRKNKLVLEIHNGIFDKDIRFYLYDGNKQVDFEKIRASEDASKSQVKERLKNFIEKNSLLIKQSGHISFLGFKGKTESYVKNLITR